MPILFAKESLFNSTFKSYAALYSSIAYIYAYMLRALHVSLLVDSMSGMNQSRSPSSFFGILQISHMLFYDKE